MSNNETLVIASKVKAYIKSVGDMKCSAAVIDVLSDKVSQMCKDGIEKALASKRKTVLEKDIL